MTSNLNITDIAETGYQKVWSVSDFAKRYRLDPEEETRLIKLLGAFASEQELLMNATRSPRFR